MKSLFKKEWFWLGVVLLVGAFLRLWKIENWQYFTYDQARDYLIVKKMMVDGKLTLVGPTVSIAPGFFLPPFYYYSLIPFLWLFNFRIVGPDVYTAILGIASIFVFYLLSKDLFKEKTALISSLIFALNPYLVHAARHAWNPNTIIFYILLFALASERYLFECKRKYLLLACFSLAVAVSLHLTAAVFIPFLIYLFYKELREHNLNLWGLFSLTPFVFFFAPLMAFDLRHGFQISKAGWSFLNSQGKGEPVFLNLLSRGVQLIFDLVKVPVILLSGLFLEKNITIRPSDLTLLGSVNLLKVAGCLEWTKLILSLMIIGSITVLVIRQRKDKRLCFLLAFLVLGFLIRLLFPPSYFFFYYYLCLFPFVFLLLAFFFSACLKEKRLVFQNLPIFMAVLLTFLSLLPNFIKTDTRGEDYFLPVAEVIAQDYQFGVKVAVAANVTDRLRWDRNGLEYRYFLESRFHLPLGLWETSDYQKAEVLYFVDEGEIEDPLKMGGMEMESFGPKKVENVWTVSTGQKVYKLSSD